MATLDEIFAAMPDAPTVGTHELLIIDPDLRQIDVPDAERIFGVENDNKAERKYFQCPRYVGDGLDLAACSLRVTFTNANDETDAYVVEDLTVSGAVVLFSWELSRKVTMYKGDVHFLVYAGAEDGTDWHTTMADGYVLEGKEIDASDVEEKTSDVITQLLLMVAKQTAAVEAEGAAQIDAVEEAAAAATAEAKAAIEAKGAATLATIPADYTAMGAQVDALARTTAGAIVCAAEGETILVHDASDHHLQGLRIFGRSTQDGTPTPDAPVEIVSTPAPAVTVCGKNLLNADEMVNGQFEKNADGTYTITKNGAGTLRFSEKATCSLPAGPYVLSIQSAAGTEETVRIAVTYDNGRELALTVTAGNPKPFTTEREAVKIAVYIPADREDGAYTKLGGLMLEYGSHATEYEPYKELQTITMANDLPGIPVASGGNYTDANGQQWICDEVDLGRGVYVQRVNVVGLEGATGTREERANGTHRFTFPLSLNPGFLPAKSIGGEYPGMCTALTPAFNVLGYNEVDNVITAYALGGIYIRCDKYATVDALVAWAEGIGLRFAYVIEEEIEKPLTDAEIMAFKALRSNKPTTVLLNDSGAHMAAEYVADTKLYIDRKIAELVAATTT